MEMIHEELLQFSMTKVNMKKMKEDISTIKSSNELNKEEGKKLK